MCTRSYGRALRRVMARETGPVPHEGCAAQTPPAYSAAVPSISRGASLVVKPTGPYFIVGMMNDPSAGCPSGQRAVTVFTLV